MMIDLQYVQRRKNHFRYRRKVPAALQEVYGKREIVLPLGKTEAEVVKRWPKAHKEAETQLAAAIRVAENPQQPIPQRTPLERFKLQESEKNQRQSGPRW